MDTLRSIESAWRAWMLAATWQVVLLVVLVLLATSVLRRGSARLRYALWLLVLVKLLTPPSLSAPWSLMQGVAPARDWLAQSWAPPTSADLHASAISADRANLASQDSAMFATIETSAPNAGSSLTNPGATQTAGSPAPSDTDRERTLTPTLTSSLLARLFAAHRGEILLFAWLAGVLLWLAIVLIRYARLTRQLACVPAVEEGPLRVLLERLTLRLSGGHQGGYPSGPHPPDLLLSDRVTSPFLYGLLRPRIVLPVGLPESLSPAELEGVLLHELIHWRRRDLAVGWLQVLTQAAFWFHPLVWLANAQVRHERECATDEAVLALGHAAPRVYGESLLRVLLAVRGRSSAALGFLGIFERNTRLQKRLEEIMNQEVKVRQFSWGGWLFLVLFAAACLPMSISRGQQAAKSGYAPQASALAASQNKPDAWRQALQKKVTVDIKKSPDGSPLTPQYAAIAICVAADIPYEWEKSTQQADPERRRFIEPLHVKDIPAEEALKKVLDPLGLVYTIDDLGLYIAHKGQAQAAATSASTPTTTEAAPQPQNAKDTIPDYPGSQVLKHDDGTADGKQSYGGGGHAILFETPDGGFALTGLELFGSRYGLPQPPAEDFQITILDENMKPLRTIGKPYALFERGDQKWVPMSTGNLTVPKKFWVAINFNAHQTKGVYVSFDTSGQGNFSKKGTVESGFSDLEPGKNWMIRAHVAPVKSIPAGELDKPPVSPNAGSIKMPQITESEPVGPPQILSTNPAIGATDVAPNITEIAVTFNQDMMESYSWTGGGPNYPKGPQGARPVWRDARTCVLPVTLEPAHYYRVGINAKSFHGFQNRQGVPANPKAIYFTTLGASEELKNQVRQPKIVKLEPANGATDADPNLTELKVTFDLPMGGGMSWCGGGDHFPVIPDGQGAQWSEDKKTCTLPVKLKPGWDYELAINCPSANNFMSQWGVSADPTGYSFQTRK